MPANSATIDEEFAFLESKVAAGRSQLNDYQKRKHADDRSTIGRLVVWLFVFAIGLSVLVLLIALLLDLSQNKDLVEPVVTILSSILLPVVTLVIGYYFGTENRQ